MESIMQMAAVRGTFCQKSPSDPNLKMWFHDRRHLSKLSHSGVQMCPDSCQVRVPDFKNFKARGWFVWLYELLSELTIYPLYSGLPLT